MLRRMLTAVAAFDYSKVDIGFALRSSIGVAVPLVAALAAGHAALGAAAAVGALSAGFASQQGVYRTRAAAMLWTSSGMAVSAFVGALGSHDSAVIVVVFATWGYLYGIIASLGPAATAAALNSTIALIVFSNLNVELSPVSAAVQSAGVLAGGVLQTLLLVLVWPIGRFAIERRALAEAYHALAEYARSLAGGEAAPPSASPIAAVRATLADPRPFARRGDAVAFQALLDEAERLRGSLAALAAAQRAPDALAVEELSPSVSALLDDIADGLKNAGEPRDDSDAWSALERAIDALARGRSHAAADAAALAGQLRAAWRIAEAPAGAGGRNASIPRRERVFPTLADALATLRANIAVTSPYGRLAIRLAAALGVAAAIYRAYDLRNGYWLALTVVILLKPDYTTTMARGIARVAGTLCGAAIATAIATYLNPSPHVDVALCIAFAALGYVAFNANYTVYAVTITAYVIFMLALLGQPEHAAVLARVEATLGGAALAGLATLVWPTWESERAGERLAELLEAQRDYASVLLATYVAGTRPDTPAVRAAQSAAWAARAAAESSVDRMIGEPLRTHALPVATALGILAASRRLALALLALNVHSRRGAAPRPELGPLALALYAANSACASSLREHRAPADSPSLRGAFDEARRASAGVSDALLLELDFIVDAVNTITSLLRGGFGERRARIPNG